MAFDIVVRRPKSPEGKYFFNNGGTWHALAPYVLANVRIPAKEAERWHTNDGQIVSSATAIKIADVLEKLIAEGSVSAYAKERTRRLRKLPLVRCELCKGADIIRENEGRKNERKCPMCKGKGRTPSLETYLRFTVENVAAFAKFCRQSGGFRIW